MKIYLKLEPPFEWARVSGASVEAFGEVQSLSEYPIGKDDTVIGVVPGEWVTTHRVSLPTKTRKQFNQALPFALEDSISESIENIHLVCVDWAPATEVSVLSIAKDKMLEWQSLANENSLPIEQLLPDYALIPFHDSAQCSISVDNGVITTRHAELGGVALDESLIEVWLMEVPIADTIAVNDEEFTQRLINEYSNRDFRHWPFGNKMRHWLEYGMTSNVDLWADAYRPKMRRLGKRSFVWPALAAACSVILLIAYSGYRYYSLRTEINHLDAQMVKILKQALPDIQGVSGGDARTFMQRAINRGQGPIVKRGFHEVLADASRVMNRMRATLLELNYQNGELVLTCVLNDFSQVDALTKQFNSLKLLEANLQGSSAEDGKIIATYNLRQRG